MLLPTNVIPNFNPAAFAGVLFFYFLYVSFLNIFNTKANLNSTLTLIVEIKTQRGDARCAITIFFPSLFLFKSQLQV